MVEAVESALGPRRLQPGHDRQRAVPVPRERRHHRVAPLRHQSPIEIGIADRGAREQADVRQPRLAAERRGLDGGRHDGAAGLADGRGKVGTGWSQGLPELGPLPAGDAVGLDEEQHHVGSTHVGEVRVDRGRWGHGAAPAPRCLARELGGFAGDRRAHGGSDRRGGEQVAGHTLDTCQGEHADRRGRRQSPHGRRGGRLAHDPDCPAHGQEQQRRNEDQGGAKRQDEAGLRHVGEHGPDVGQQLQVPIEVHLAAVERPRAHIHVVGDDQDHPQGREQALGRAGDRRRSASRRQGEAEHQASRLERQPQRRLDSERRPDADEGERPVEQDDRDGEPCPPPHSAARRPRAHPATIVCL